MLPILRSLVPRVLLLAGCLAQRCALPIQSINQLHLKSTGSQQRSHGTGRGGGGGGGSGVHSIGRGTVRCGRRLAGPARPVGWKLRAGISLRSGCGGWCRGGIEKGSVPRLLWEQGNGGSAGHVPVGQWLPCGRWGRSDRGRRMWGKTNHRVGALGREGLSSGSAMPCRKSCRGGGGCQWAICGCRRSGRVYGGGVGFRQFFGSGRCAQRANGCRSGCGQWRCGVCGG